MSTLAAITAGRSGAASIMVANRTRRHADRLAAKAGAAAVALADLGPALAGADLVISCTGADGYVLTRDLVSAALAGRKRRGPLIVLDLAMPRDVEPAVTGLPGVVVIGMDRLSEHGTDAGADDVAAVRAIGQAELAAYQSAVDAARVAPTVVALRAKAATVVDAELARLAGRLSTARIGAAASGADGCGEIEWADRGRSASDAGAQRPDIRAPRRWSVGCATAGSSVAMRLSMAESAVGLRIRSVRSELGGVWPPRA